MSLFWDAINPYATFEGTNLRQTVTIYPFIRTLHAKRLTFNRKTTNFNEPLFTRSFTYHVTYYSSSLSLFKYFLSLHHPNVNITHHYSYWLSFGHFSVTFWSFFFFFFFNTTTTASCQPINQQASHHNNHNNHNSDNNNNNNYIC